MRCPRRTTTGPMRSHHMRRCHEAGTPEAPSGRTSRMIRSSPRKTHCLHLRYCTGANVSMSKYGATRPARSERSERAQLLHTSIVSLLIISGLSGHIELRTVMQRIGARTPEFVTVGCITHQLDKSVAKGAGKSREGVVLGGSPLRRRQVSDA
jgi:hypothetical protein